VFIAENIHNKADKVDYRVYDSPNERLLLLILFAILALGHWEILPSGYC
jgi:hypothetical protein